jgi:hypothetical protein
MPVSVAEPSRSNEIDAQEMTGRAMSKDQDDRTHDAILSRPIVACVRRTWYRNQMPAAGPMLSKTV